MAKQQTLRKQQRSFTRQRFIQAGLEVFSRVGFNEATIDMITDEAGANRSTFYLHFKDKIELVLASHEVMDPMGESIMRPLNSQKTLTLKEFRQWLEDYAVNWEEHHHLYGALTQAQFSSPEVTQNNYALLASYLDKYQVRFRGKALKQAKLKIELFFMQINTFFYAVICQTEKKPSTLELDTLAELGYFTLFGDEQG